jgi:hypothetical protein
MPGSVIRLLMLGSAFLFLAPPLHGLPGERPSAPSTQILQTQYFRLICAGMPVDELRQLGALGDQFIGELSREWQVRFQGVRFDVSIRHGGALPHLNRLLGVEDWVSSSYQMNSQTILLHIHRSFDWELQAVFSHLKFQTVRALLLGRGDRELHVALATGFAMRALHRMDGNWRYRAVLLFLWQDDLAKMLHTAPMDVSARQQVACFLLANHFVDEQGEKATEVLHGILRGRRYRDLAVNLGVPHFDKLVQDMIRVESARYRWYHLLLGKDPYLILASLLFLVLLVRKLWRLRLWARTGPPLQWSTFETPAADESEEWGALLNVGAKGRPALPGQGTPKLPEALPHPVEGEIERDLDQFFTRHQAGAPGSDTAPPRIAGMPAAAPGPRIRTAADGSLLVEDIVPEADQEWGCFAEDFEGAVDQIFPPPSGGVAEEAEVSTGRHAETAPAEAAPAEEDPTLSEDLDRFFKRVGKG